MADEKVAESGGPTIKDLNSMVEVDGEVFRLSDLIESLRKAGTIAEEVSDLRVFHESASKFMRREGEQHEIADAASKSKVKFGTNTSSIISKCSRSETAAIRLIS
jgi:hypothetical protein